MPNLRIVTNYATYDNNLSAMTEPKSISKSESNFESNDASAHPTAPCYTYVLGSISDCNKSGSARTYTGWAHDVEARLAKHNSGQGAKATRGRQWAVLHVESFKTRGEAMSREAALKKQLRKQPAFRLGLLAKLPLRTKSSKSAKVAEK